MRRYGRPSGAAGTGMSGTSAIVTAHDGDSPALEQATGGGDSRSAIRCGSERAFPAARLDAHAALEVVVELLVERAQ